jgi:hypothetical protein
MVTFGFFRSGLNFLGKESLTGGGFGLEGSLILTFFLILAKFLFDSFIIRTFRMKKNELKIKVVLFLLVILLFYLLFSNWDKIESLVKLN